MPLKDAVSSTTHSVQGSLSTLRGSTDMHGSSNYRPISQLKGGSNVNNETKNDSQIPENKSDNDSDEKTASVVDDQDGHIEHKTKQSNNHDKSRSKDLNDSHESSRESHTAHKPTSPKDDHRSHSHHHKDSEDEGEDAAMPFGDMDTNFFSTLMNNTTLSSGFGSLRNLKASAMENFLKRKKDNYDEEKPSSHLHHHHHHHHNQSRPHHLNPGQNPCGSTSGTLSPSLSSPSSRPGSPSSQTSQHGTSRSGSPQPDFNLEHSNAYLKRGGHGFLHNGVISGENSTAEDSTDEEEEYDAAGLSDPGVPQREAVETFLANAESTSTATAMNSEVTSYSTLNNDTVTNSETLTDGETLKGSRKNTIVLDGEGAEGLTNDQIEHLTPFQKSVINKLDPHHIKEGVLVKIKDRQNEPLDDRLNATRRMLRYRIAERLTKTFDLKPDDIFCGNFNSWLVKDVILQGHIYLTEKTLLYFAFLPKRFNTEDPKDQENFDDSANNIHKGTLGMKTAKYGDSKFSSVLTHRYWAILRTDTLTIYSSFTDLYFPLKVIDLRTCLYAEILTKEKGKEATSPTSKSTQTGSAMRSGYTSGYSTPPSISETPSDLESMLSQEGFGATEDNVEARSSSVWIGLVSKKKTYRFQCDNLHSARQWCNNLTKQIFQLHNATTNGEVLVKIPIANITDFRRRTIFEEEEGGIDDAENDIPLSLSIKYVTNDPSEKRKRDKIKEKLNKHGEEEIIFLIPKNGLDFFKSFEGAMEKQANKVAREKHNMFGSKKQELEKSYSTLSPSLNALVQNVIDSNLPEEKRDSGSALKRFGKSFGLSAKSDDSSVMSDGGISRLDMDHLSFPHSLSEKVFKDLEITFETTFKNLKDATSRWDNDYHDIITAMDELPIPSISANPKESKKRGFSKSIKLFSNMTARFSASPIHYTIEDKYYVSDAKEREIALKHFQEHFSLYNSRLVASYFCHLLRTVPVYGKLYVSEHEICFRSLLPGVSTKMILPSTSIEGVEPISGKIYAGTKLILQGAEELDLEFAFAKSRDDFTNVALELLGKLHANEGFRPKPHEWGPNYNLELSKTRMEYTDSERKKLEEKDSRRDLEIAESKVGLARIKMFEDRLTTASGLDVPIVLEDSPFFKTEMKPSTSYNITLLTIGSRGDVQPYIALALGLQKEGHVVTIATHGEFKDWIEKDHHIKFKEIAGNPSELMSFMVGHSSLSVTFLKDAQAKFKGWIAKLLTTSWEACQGADILIESPSAMAGIHIAEALVIPYFRAFTMPWTRTRAYPQAFLVPDQKKGGSFNYLTYVLFDNVFWKGIQAQVNKWRVRELDLPKTNLYRMSQTKVPFLYNVSPCVLPPANDFPDWVKVTGYWFLDEGKKDYKPPQDLVDFINQAAEDEKKVVYIGFGSIVVKDAASLTKAVIEAVLDAGVRCILNKGWSDRGSHKDKNKMEVELPPEVFNAGSIPHDWLLPKVDAAVHHGGSGTTGAALKAGCPSIIKPFFGDQFFYARRIEDMGAGLALKKLTAKSLAKALVTVTEDLKIIEKAKSVSSQIHREYGVLNAIEALYSDLEYARSLIWAKELHNANYKRHHPDYKTQSGVQTADVSEDESESDYGSDSTSDEEDDDGDVTEREDETEADEKERNPQEKAKR
ncbi:ATG26 [Candida margitis]|uniref:ATG26 n=1 Tax=Candida margitis TaxID=1775924 RepID=UPI0022263B33|nr:ATG26 [Candida margitis]KAI5969307.1 ATG26 [Candida margitis]